MGWLDHLNQQRRSVEENSYPSRQQVFVIELQGTAEPESWAKESYEIATKIVYQNGSLRGTPKGQASDCRDVLAVTYLFRGYPATARLIADRRMYLAGYGLADLLRALD